MTYSYSYDVGNLEDTLEASVGTMIILLAISVLMIIALWKIFKKAGKGGWEAIVPVYNIIVLLEITSISLSHIILFFIPIAQIYILFKTFVELARKFGKETGFGILTVFFPYVCLPILAFSDAKYNGTTEEEKPASILDVNEAGVPSDSEANFSYGYEKEETVVMEPVVEEKKVEETTKEEPKEE